MEKTKVLIVAAHPDDEVLGAFSYLSNPAFICKTIFLCEGSSARFDSKTSLIEKTNAIDLREKAAVEVAHQLKNGVPVFINFPNFSLSQISILEINQKIRKELELFMPDVLITHSTFCNNLDHSTASVAISNLVRSNAYPQIACILHMEIPSSTEQKHNGGFTPNLFRVMSDYQVSEKIRMLSIYGDELQIDPAPRSPHAIRAYAGFRGLGAGTFYAEAFQLVRYIGNGKSVL